MSTSGRMGVAGDKSRSYCLRTESEHQGLNEQLDKLITHNRMQRTVDEKPYRQVNTVHVI